MSRLSFEEFLIALRDAGVAVGVGEQARLLQVLADYDGSSRTELRVVVGALLGGDLEGRERVRLVFDHYFPPAEQDVTIAEILNGKQEAPRKELSSGAQKGWRTSSVTNGLVLLLMVAGFYFLGLIWNRDTHMPPLGPKDTQPISRSPEVNDYLPETPTAGNLAWRGPAAGCLAALVWLIWLGQGLRSEKRRAASVERGRWLSTRPGPHRYRLKLPRVNGLLRSEDLDDFAVLLGRLDEAQAGSLDVDSTVRAYACRGFLVKLFRRRLRRRMPIVVLRDVSAESQVFGGKVDALLRGLSRRGIPLVVFTFEGDGRHLWRDGEGPGAGAHVGLPLAEVYRRYPGAPLLVIGVGGVHLRRAFRLLPWLSEVQRHFTRRAWLNPLEDPQRWDRSMVGDDFPLPVWPMTRTGFRGAAAALLPPERRTYVARRELLMARPVTQDDVEQAARLIAMIPYAELGLAEHILHEFCPGLPTDVLWDLFTQGTNANGTVLHWPEAILSRLLTRHRESEVAGRTALRELNVRRFLAALYRASVANLPEASVARLRGERDAAVQLLYLADQRQEALAEIQRVATRLGREEVAEALKRLVILPVPDESGVEMLPEQLEAALQAGEQVAADHLAVGLAWVWGGFMKWPGEFWIRGTLLCAVCVLGLWGIGGYLTKGHKREHQETYVLTWEAGALKVGPVPGSARILLDRLPRDVGVYCERPTNGPLMQIKLDRWLIGRVPLSEHMQEHWCLVRADRLDGAGEQVHSNLVWVPKLELVKPSPHTIPSAHALTGQLLFRLTTPELAIADVKVDGRSISAEVVDHPAGVARISVETPYLDFRDARKVSVGKEETVIINLKKTHGLVVLDELPVGVRLQARSPLKIWNGTTVRGPAGDYVDLMSWRTAGGQVQTIVIHIEAGRTLRQRVTMPREKTVPPVASMTPSADEKSSRAEVVPPVASMTPSADEKTTRAEKVPTVVSMKPSTDEKTTQVEEGRLVAPTKKDSSPNSAIKKLPVPFGSGCFGPATKIAMADGTEREISQVRVGDRVLSKGEGAELIEATVVDTGMAIEEVLIINETTRISRSQKISSNSGEWIRAEFLKTGSYVENFLFMPKKIETIRSAPEMETVYWLEVSLFHTYFADGILVHNKSHDNGSRVF